MECREAARLLSPALDGELEPPAARELERHLAVCDVCRRQRRALVAVREQFRRLPPKRSRLRADDVLARVAREEAAAGRAARRRIGRLALPVAAALAVAVLGWWQLVPRQAPAPPSAAGAAGGAAAPAVGAVQPLPAALSDLDCGPQGTDREACKRVACLAAEDCGAGAEELWPPISL